MLEIILLLTPVYITLFWFVVLNLETTRKANTPKIFLGKFMLAAFVVYLSHFLYFTPLSKYYHYIDPIYQYASLMVYPIFYVYVRLLTIDARFSFRKHAIYFLPSTLLFVSYSIGVIPGLNHSLYMLIVKTVVKIVFAIQVIISVSANFILIKKYGDRALHYYSNIEDSRMNKIQMLNILMIISAVASVTLGILGRGAFSQNSIGLILASAIFSTILFLIGWLGNKQSVINPTFETNSDEIEKIEPEPVEKNSLSNDLESKLNYLLREKKLFLNSKLTIKDLSLTIGTNRTELSCFINSRYKKNFCSYINSFRVKEMQKIKEERPDYTQSMLAEMSGFGSVDSMKRAVKNAEEEQNRKE